MHFQVKSTLKNKCYHNTKWALSGELGLYKQGLMLWMYWKGLGVGGSIEIRICIKILKNDSRGKFLGFLLATNNLKCKDTFITYSKSLEESDDMDDGKMELMVASESIFNQLSLCWWLSSMHQLTLHVEQGSSF